MPLGEQITDNLDGLCPKRGCSSKRVNRVVDNKIVERIGGRKYSQQGQCQKRVHFCHFFKPRLDTLSPLEPAIGTRII